MQISCCELSKENERKMKERVAIYCRLSEEDKNKRNKEDDSESIINQKLMLTEYAIRQDWKIIGVFSDDDFTGADRDRPGFNEVITLAEQRKIDIILCKSQSRFTRELEMVEKYINYLFIEWNVRFIGLVDNADTNVKGNKKSRQINGLVNEWYIEDMSESIKSVLTAKRKNGQYIGSVALYGYKKDPQKKGHLIIDPEAAEVVRRIFSLYNQGYGKTAIAKILNNEGIPNPTKYKMQQGIAYKTPVNKRGTYWKYYSISNMLCNEMYIGNMVQGKYGSISYKSHKNKPKPKDEWIRVEGTHEPIIEMELWNNVQSKINKNFKPYTSGKIGLFAKKCKCLYCNYTMKSSKSHGDRYLRCSSKQVAKNCCKGGFISEKALEKAVLKELNNLLEQYLNINELEEKIVLKQFRNSKEQLEHEIIKHESKLNTYLMALKDLYIDKTTKIISKEEFIVLSNDIKKDREKIEKLINERKKQLLELNNHQEFLKSKRQLLEKYINVEQLSKEMIDNLIDFIEIGRKEPETRNLPIIIHWKF